MTDYLTIAELLAIQEDQIERYGGAHGVRGRRRLARARPEFVGAVLVALEACDHPHAPTIAAALRRFREGPI